ncbi:hypothetical protein [Streptomyces sp. NPDC001914]|uniref:hypothetical protein n=1 Tax=Streptomyces sp. NPDC001914 TaxID=3364623 RepID=UPI003699DDCF
MQDDDAYWWVMPAVAAGFTVVFGAVLLLVVTVCFMGTDWVRQRRRRLHEGESDRSA